jgi:ComF family protein
MHSRDGKRKWPAFAAIPSRMADLFCPRDCLACGEPAGERFRWLCEKCAASLPLTTADHCCELCGMPFGGVVTTQRACAECAELAPLWTRGKTLLCFDGPAKELVHHLKYNGERCVLDDVRTLLRGRADVARMLRGSILVPVPLHHSRRRERGFNQSEWLADVFAKESGADARDLLLRTRDTGTQTLLSREERLKNMHGAFEVRRGARISSSARYVLVDDVITTGSTLNSCAKVLHRAGAVELAVLTLAHA